MEDSVHESFDLVLDKVFKGSSDLKAPVCTFNYTWDKQSNMGIANLQEVNGTPVNIVLHPLGIAGQLDFMSDMEPTGFSVDALPGEEVEMTTIVIYRVILDIDGDKRTAAIMFGEEGENILTSEGFADDSAARHLPEVQFERTAAPEGVEPPTAE